MISNDITSSSKLAREAAAPESKRFGTKEYWKSMYETQLKISRRQMQIPVSPEEVWIINVEKIKIEKKDHMCHTSRWQHGTKGNTC